MSRRQILFSILDRLSIDQLINEAHGWLRLDEERADADRRKRTREDKIEHLAELEEELRDLRARNVPDTDKRVLTLRSVVCTYCFKCRWNNQGIDPPV